MNPEEKLQELQGLEQQSQSLQSQRQQFQQQLLEIENAQKEVGKTNESYKIVGNVMVAANKEELLKELGEKAEHLQVRVNALVKQEEILREQSKKLQEEVMQGLKENEHN